MGMNIYTKVNNKHIGKRWANGIWCWDCRIRAERDKLGMFWFCTKCRQRCSDKTLFYNPAIRELGFDKKKSKKHTGIDGASGFIWCINKETGLAETRKEIKEKIKSRKLKTEYGDKWTYKEFENMMLDVITEEDSDSDFS